MIYRVSLIGDRKATETKVTNSLWQINLSKGCSLKRFLGVFWALIVSMFAAFPVEPAQSDDLAISSMNALARR
jgi:hypothetical protein